MLDQCQCTLCKEGWIWLICIVPPQCLQASIELGRSNGSGFHTSCKEYYFTGDQSRGKPWHRRYIAERPSWSSTTASSSHTIVGYPSSRWICGRQALWARTVMVGFHHGYYPRACKFKSLPCISCCTIASAMMQAYFVINCFYRKTLPYLFEIHDLQGFDCTPRLSLLHVSKVTSSCYLQTIACIWMASSCEAKPRASCSFPICAALLSRLTKWSLISQIRNVWIHSMNLNRSMHCIIL